VRKGFTKIRLGRYLNVDNGILTWIRPINCYLHRTATNLTIRYHFDLLETMSRQINFKSLLASGKDNAQQFHEVKAIQSSKLAVRILSSNARLGL